MRFMFSQPQALASSLDRIQDPTNLYFANMPLHWSEEDLRRLVAQFGQVLSTYVMRDAGACEYTRTSNVLQYSLVS